LIGEILQERGYVSAENLRTAIEYQKTSPELYIGEILIRLGFLDEIDIVTALVLQCNLPYIAISKYKVDEEVIRLIPADVAWRNRVVPLDRIGSVLSVVMSSPVEEAFRDEMERLTGCTIAMFISTSSEISAALSRFYSSKD